jgi:hypothetical protein
MIRTKVCAIVVGVAVAAGASAGCPISECNYLDPTFAANLKKWSECTNAYASRIIQVMESLAVLYPRFGIAYNAYSDEIKNAIHSDGTSDRAALDEAKRRFDDRILNTAEPEALQDYNMLMLSGKQYPVGAQCGAMPEPPRKNATP